MDSLFQKNDAITVIVCKNTLLCASSGAQRQAAGLLGPRGPLLLQDGGDLPTADPARVFSASPAASPAAQGAPGLREQVSGCPGPPC